MAATLCAVGLSSISSVLAAVSRSRPIARIKPAANADPFYRFDNQADDPSVIDIHVVDFIGDWIDDYYGFGVTAKAFIADLAKLPADVKTIRVHINSPGGDVFSALNIANALRDQQQTKGRAVETIVDGLAASAASIILMAGGKVTVADNGLVMIHDPSTVAWGNAKDLREAADTLDTITKTIVATYKWHSSLSEEELTALVNATTWMDADEAIANGFATDKREGLTAAASITPSALDVLDVPEKYRARVQSLLKPAPVSNAMAAAEVLRVCREGGCLELAENLIAVASTPAQVTEAVRVDRETRAVASARATEIRAICKIAKFEDLAAGYIASGMPIADVRAHVTTLKAKLASAEIVGDLAPDHSSRNTPRIDTGAIYARLNTPQR